MYSIANESKKNRQELFNNTARNRGINPAIIEKDFWVCFLLELLFHKSGFADRIAFKGGTSLSKAYQAIRRFSEDVDLVLDDKDCSPQDDKDYAPQDDKESVILSEAKNPSQDPSSLRSSG